MRIALATGLAAILGLAAAGSAPAQDAQDALKQKYAEKMAEINAKYREINDLLAEQQGATTTTSTTAPATTTTTGSA